jgi:glycosyltransferase involved in cell wall biosynthesis
MIEIFRVAYRTNSALQLVLVGDGPLRPAVERAAARCGLRIGRSTDDVDSSVILMGMTPDPMSCIAQCDFLILPSVMEGFGLVLIEGFSVGIPALAADCKSGGVHDAMGGAAIYRPDRTDAEQTSCGFLMPVPTADNPQTIEIWRQHILRMAEDPELRHGLGKGALARAQSFAPAAASARWFELLDGIG